MARISKDELEYCVRQNVCSDCHSEENVKAAVEFQTRGRLKVPCCRKHFNAYRSKINEADARKYARTSAVQREAGECNYKGCHHKLIPQELLPPWWKREGTCGMHVAFKAFRVNREGLLNILLGLAKPGLYHTKCFSASDLLERYKQFRQRKFQPVERNRPYPSS